MSDSLNDEPQGAVGHDAILLRHPATSTLVNDRYSPVNPRPRQHRGLAGVLLRTAAQLRLVAGKCGEFLHVREFNRLQPFRCQHVREVRQRRNPRENLVSHFDRRYTSIRMDDRLKCRQPPRACEVAQRRVVKDQRWAHASGSNSRLHASNSRLHASSGTSSCSGSSERSTVPHNNSKTRASVSFPRRYAARTLRPYIGGTHGGSSSATQCSPSSMKSAPEGGRSASSSRVPASMAPRLRSWAHTAVQLNRWRTAAATAARRGSPSNSDMIT